MSTTSTPTPMAIHGVPGMLKRQEEGTSYSRHSQGKSNVPGTWFKQEWESKPRKFKGKELIVCTIRFDDNCLNGHNSFAITGHTFVPGRDDWETGGCIHESIAEFFPELEHLIKWHLVSTDGPMHYVSNAMHHASNLHNGKAKGEPNSWETRVQFGDWPMTVALERGFREWLMAAIDHRSNSSPTNRHRKQFDIVAVPHVNKPGGNYDFGPHYSFDDFTSDWYKAPFKTLHEAQEFKACMELVKEQVREVAVVTGYSPGKERNLQAARLAANWPEATDEQLCLPPAELKALLEARLPGLLERFRQTIEATGLSWAPSSGEPNDDPSGDDGPSEPPKEAKPEPKPGDLGNFGASVAMTLADGGYFDRGF